MSEGVCTYKKVVPITMMLGGFVKFSSVIDNAVWKAVPYNDKYQFSAENNQVIISCAGKRLTFVKMVVFFQPPPLVFNRATECTQLTEYVEMASMIEVGPFEQYSVELGGLLIANGDELVYKRISLPSASDVGLIKEYLYRYLNVYRVEGTTNPILNTYWFNHLSTSTQLFFFADLYDRTTYMTPNEQPGYSNNGNFEFSAGSQLMITFNQFDNQYLSGKYFTYIINGIGKNTSILYNGSTKSYYVNIPFNGVLPTTVGGMYVVETSVNYSCPYEGPYAGPCSPTNLSSNIYVHENFGVDLYV